jgi:serine/threonine-protein kinase
VALDYDEAPDTTVDLPPELRTPLVQIGSYALGPAIAEGGMGTIHLGRRRGPGRFSRVFAIKRLRSHLADDEAVVGMLLEEARFAGAIRHGNVVPVLDVVIERGEVLLVMEYVHGASVSQLWKTLRAPMPIPIALAIATGALRGVHAAHEARDDRDVPLGLVHRDMSPHNVLVGVDGITRVTDFGIAKAAIASAPATQVGRVKGKLRYLAPEQRIGEAVSPRTDIYGLTVVLWEMLTGRRLWDGETDQEIMVRALRERARPPSTFNRLVSPTLDALVRRGLEMDPALRFETAREMATALERLGPIASPTEVADWVARVARVDLARIAASMVDDDATPPNGRARPSYAPITSSDIRPKAGAVPPVQIPRPPRLPSIVRTPQTAIQPVPSLVPPVLAFDPEIAEVSRTFRRKRLIGLVLAAAVIVGALGSLALAAALS